MYVCMYVCVCAHIHIGKQSQLVHAVFSNEWILDRMQVVVCMCKDE